MARIWELTSFVERRLETEVYTHLRALGPHLKANTGLGRHMKGTLSTGQRNTWFLTYLNIGSSLELRFYVSLFYRLVS